MYMYIYIYSRYNFPKGNVFPSAFNKCLINCGKIVPCLMQYSKNMGNDQKPRCSSSIVTATPQFENFAIPLITLQNLKILLSLPHGIFMS